MGKFIMVSPVFQTKKTFATSLLREAIIRGEFTPGTRLLLEELAQKFNLSLTPIREAFPILESEGFITQVAHKGAVVAQMDREEIQEVYAIRIALEELATSEAIPKLASQHLQQMEELVNRLDNFQGSLEDFLDLDRSFHLTLYSAAGSLRWVETIQIYWLRSKRYMLTAMSAAQLNGSIQDDHHQLLHYCQEKDRAQAIRVIRQHLKRSEEYLLKQWTLKS
jgi:DNA-binding GntR family transcriptional regulator